MMMVKVGDADAFITGGYSKYSETIELAKEIIGIRPEYKHFGAMHILSTRKGTFFLADTLESFNKKKPSLEGIASGELIQANTTGDWGKGSTISICKPKSAAPSKMLVSVRPGTVSATFTATKAAPVKAMLMNAMGQVIAQQSFTASKGMNSVELTSSYRGPAMLIVKQGSQQFVQKINLK